MKTLLTILLIGALYCTYGQDVPQRAQNDKECAVYDTVRVIMLVTHHDGKHFNSGAAGWIKGYVVRREDSDLYYLDWRKKRLSEKYLIWDYSEVIKKQ